MNTLSAIQRWRSGKPARSPHTLLDLADRFATFLRWPTILTQIVSTLSNEIHHVTTSKESESEASKEKIEEGKEIIRSISELKHDMGRNKVLS